MKLLDMYKHRPEWSSELHNQINLLWQERKYFILTIIGFLIFLYVAMSAGHKNSTIANAISMQNKRIETILHDITAVNAIIQEANSNQFYTKQQQAALQTLEKNILETQQSLINVAKTSDIQKISTQIINIKENMDSQLNDIKKIIAQDDNKKHYINENPLPFHVISIDVIAGQTYISMEYDNYISLLSVGDALAGWKVINIDFNNMSAEFENETHQYYKFVLQGTV